MKLLLLRGQVPQDRDKSEIKYSCLEDCDDIYTLMASRLADDVRVWYWGGVRLWSKPGFIEEWVPEFNNFHSRFEPDIIWARGGFKEYAPVLKKYSHAFKVYYGAGRRFVPEDGIKYDLVLVDSEAQKRVVERKIHGVRCELWIKPAPDNLVKPVGCPKLYDVCYMANGTQDKIKRIEWVYKTVPEDLNVLHLGTNSDHKPPKNVHRRRVLRKDIAAEISKCKVGIVPYKDIDSCPRAMVEMIACGLNVVVTDDLLFWNDKYPAMVASKANFWDTVRRMLDYNEMDMREHYLKNLSLDCAVKRLRELLPC